MAASVHDLARWGEEFVANPHGVFERLRLHGPVHRVRLEDGQVVWFVVGNGEAQAALVDPRLSRDWAAAARDYPGAVNPSGSGHPVFGKHLLITDPPDSVRLRRVAAAGFTRARVEALRPRIEQITRQLVRAIEPNGRADVVADFAEPLAGTVICDLLGVPALDRVAVLKWVHDLAHTDGDLEREYRTAVAFKEWIARFVQYKRQVGSDDLVGRMVETCREDPSALAWDELPAMVYMLLIAGYQTTVHFLSNGVHVLLRHPEQLRILRGDWTLLDNALEEIARFEGPAKFTTVRFTREPVQLGAMTIPGGGEAVYIALSAANRDSTRFAEAHRFDIQRVPRGHLAYGRGGRYCLGAPLARLQGAAALRGLLERLVDLTIGPEPMSWYPGLLFRGLRRLPVTFTPVRNSATAGRITMELTS